MPEANEFTFQVVKVEQPIGTFYIGSLSAKTVVQISYSDVRRIEARDVEKYLGIQRPLDLNRVRQIRKYLGSPDASFPTGIILAVAEDCAVYDGESITLMPFINNDYPSESIPVDHIAKILDGQHRIAAFVDSQWKFDEAFVQSFGSQKFDFNVIIFVGLDIDEQANIFATVNLAQTKVNRSLAYDLEGLSKTRSPFKTCHQIAVALDSVDPDGPLYHRIKRLGVKTKGRTLTEPLTQAGFVESLIKLITPTPLDDRNLYMRGKKPSKFSGDDLKKHPFRNLFIDGKDEEIGLILYNYFSSIRNTWPDAWNKRDREGNILPKSNAFKAFMRFLKRAYNEAVGDKIGTVPEISAFENVFRKLNVSNEDFTSGNFKPGSSGEAAFFKLLTGELRIQDLKN